MGERVNAIIDRFYNQNALDGNDLEWLLEQAEKVERLEAENKRLRQLLHNWGLNPDAVPKEMPDSLMSEKKEPL